jgi:drug/metabolite transporter (DMT)-like permease
MHLALLALVACVVALTRRAPWPRARQIWEPILIGLGLFVAPAVSSNLSKDSIPDLTRVAIFSLTPVFAVAFEPHLGRLTESQSKKGLLAALGCVLGTLGVFPLEIPRTLEGAASFSVLILGVVCVAAANCWAVRFVSDLPGKAGASVAALAGISAATGLAIGSALSERGVWNRTAVGQEFGWSVVVAMPALLLLFWLMRRMSAVRMTTRFVVTPLIVNVVGLILLRPSVNLRAGLGLALIAIGAGWLLAAVEDESDESTSLLNLKQN